MTFVEFIAPLLKKPHQEKVLATLYYTERYSNSPSLTAEQIRSALRNARVPGAAKINVPDVLGKSGHYVDTEGVSGTRRLWRLTESGKKHVRDVLGLPHAEPEVEHDIAFLSALAAKVRDPVVRSYLEEALICLQVDALRATVVFLWTGAIRTLQDEALSKANLNAALTKHDPKARNVGRIDDFSYIKDATLLLALRDLGIVDKGEKDTLQEALNLRNRCGHPTQYRPGAKKVSSFVEDLISVVFSLENRPTFAS